MYFILLHEKIVTIDSYARCIKLIKLLDLPMTLIYTAVCVTTLVKTGEAM